MNVVDFSFQDHAENFDDHIARSIPGYHELVERSVKCSRRFVQANSTVVDIGCSTGRLLTKIQEHNQAARPNVRYVGLDIVSGFSGHWRQLAIDNLRFENCDVRSYKGFDNISTAFSHFTIQFIPPADKLPLLKRIYDGMLEGGALIVAEKMLMSSGRIQDAMAFAHYDYKLEKGFSESEILDKERSLRGQMTLWTERELTKALRLVGFREIECFWRNLMFAGFWALK